MVMVTKRDGSKQSFDVEKLARSVLDAGADEIIARRVASRVEPYDGITTSDIRERVLEGLEALDPMTGRMYRSSKRLAVRQDPSADKAVVRVPRAVLNELEAEPGDELDAINRGLRCTVTVREATEPTGEGRGLGLDPFDMKRLELEEGSPLVLRNASM